MTAARAGRAREGRIRAAFVSSAPFISGAERSLQLLLRHLPAAGVDPVLLGPAGSALRTWCDANGVAFRACDLPLRDKWHPFHWIRSVRALRRVLVQESIDIIHANQVWSFQVASTAAAPLHIPRVCHMRDLADPATVRWVCDPGIEAVVFISRYLETLVAPAWKDHVRPPRIVTRINPVSPAPVVSADAEAARRSGARERFGFGRDAVVFGFVGQLAPVKGLRELVEHLASISMDRPWILAVAGRDPKPGAPYEQACREAAIRAGVADRIRWVGFLEDTAPFYHAIDIAVVPSLEEPLGRIPLEAGSHGRPSIAFATGGLPETIEVGRTGALVPTARFDRFVEEMKGMAAGDHASNGAAARVWVNALCAPDAYAAHVALLYQELIGR